jgi:hypothetical protein
MTFTIAKAILVPALLTGAGVLAEILGIHGALVGGVLLALFSIALTCYKTIGITGLLIPIHILLCMLLMIKYIGEGQEDARIRRELTQFGKEVQQRLDAEDAAMTTTRIVANGAVTVTTITEDQIGNMTVAQVIALADKNEKASRP